MQFITICHRIQCINCVNLNAEIDPYIIPKEEVNSLCEIRQADSDFTELLYVDTWPTHAVNSLNTIHSIYMLTFPAFFLSLAQVHNHNSRGQTHTRIGYERFALEIMMLTVCVSICVCSNGGMPYCSGPKAYKCHSTARICCSFIGHADLGASFIYIMALKMFNKLVMP